MKRKIELIVLLIVLTTLAFLLCGCGKTKPTAPEGFGSIRVKVCANPVARGLVNPDISVDSVRITWTDLYGRRCKHPYYTDSNGEVMIDSLFSGRYKIDALKTYNFGRFSGSADKIEVVSLNESPACQISLSFVPTGVKINEIYYGGPYTNELYYDDQYIELYNPESDTLYLDGFIICRVSTSYYADITPHQYYGHDNDGDGDMDKVVLIVQFPGNPKTGREYPIAPGQFVVCACTPIDHRQYCLTSVDLSHADYEFFNPISTRDADYPGIPNITNIYAGKTTIFMISLASDVIVLADGSDADYLDGINLSSIVDGVEYRSSVPKEKALTPVVDQGYTGVGLQKYTGLAIERITPGYDTNNSTNDFEITSHATVGDHHTPADVWHPPANAKRVNFYRVK